MRKRYAPLNRPRRDPRHYRFAMPNKILEYKLKPVEFVIFSYLCYRSAHGQGDKLTPEMVAEGVRLSMTTVKKYVASLVDRGLITFELTFAPDVQLTGTENFFTLPNEIFLLKLSPSVFSIYAYLLLIEDRRTHTCHPSYNTIAAATGMSKNTAMKLYQRRQGNERRDRLRGRVQIPEEDRLMRGLIQKSGYIKPGGGVGSYAEYIATRDGVELIDSAGQYMEYIAERPRSHGLFSGAEHTDLESTMEEVSSHPAPVWTFIYSLKREDAVRLGYNSAESWRRLLLAHQTELAQALKIPPSQIRWCAAFHDEKHHPHIHLMAWSADPKQGWESGFTPAAHQLGKCWRDGLGVYPDDEKAVMLSVTRLLQHMGEIFRDNSVPPQAPAGQQVDRQLRFKIREKKIAMGHRPDDHEEQGYCRFLW